MQIYSGMGSTFSSSGHNMFHWMNRPKSLQASMHRAN
jgi:hypothetical protein